MTNETYPTKSGQHFQHEQDSEQGILFRRSTSFYLLFAFVGLILLITVIKNIFFLGLLLVMNIVLSLLMRPFKKFYLGIELNLFSAVMAGLLYGPAAGAIFGGISTLVNFLVMWRMSMFNLLALFGYAFVGLIAPAFAGMNLVSLGILMAVVYNLFVAIPIVALFRGNIGKCLVFGVTNVVFNIVIFSALGRIVM